jgi:tripartite-type tricarboxylate transporter receptor subunit TctC
MNASIRASIGVALLAGALSPAQAAVAPDYPGRPIRIVVPQSPGASTDLTARLIAQKLTEAFKQTVVVDNRPGAGTVSGTEIVARAAPDGHTLLVVASSITINPSLYQKLPYDPVRDFTPVTQLSKFPNLLAVHPSVAAKNLQEALALIKSKPGQLNYASAGTGTGTHMSMELLKQMTGIDIAHIPYKGGGPAVTAAIGGQTQFILGTTIGLLPHVRSGKLRAIGVTSAKRSAAAPEIPTFAESGVPGYEHEPWNGLFAAAKTPRPIIVRLNAEVARLLQAPEVKKIFANEGADPVGNSPEEFAVVVRTEFEKWAKVIKAAGIKID